MPALKLILSWLVLAAFFLLFAVISGKKLKTSIFAGAAAGSALLILLAAAVPPTSVPLGFWQAFNRWLRNFIFFTLAINFVRQPSRKKSAISGLAFATTLALLDILT